MNKKYGQSSSNFRGVSWNSHAGMYEARICVQRCKYFLGLFYDDISAATVYDAWAVRLGVSSRSNCAAVQFAAEIPVVASTECRCSVCNGANFITSQVYKDGDWQSGDSIPCPKCQNQLKITS